MRLLIKRWHLFLRMQIRVAKRLKNIVTVSENSKRDISSDFGVDTERLTVVYNGVDSKTFAPRANVQRQPMQLISTASADQPLKGTRYLIEAMALLSAEFPDLRLIFIGKPNPGEQLDQRLEATGLKSRIEFHHGIEADAIADLYARASIAVVPSEYEGFGFPQQRPWHARSPWYQLPGVLTRSRGRCRHHSPRKDAQALVAGIRKLLVNPELTD